MTHEQNNKLLNHLYNEIQSTISQVTRSLKTFDEGYSYLSGIASTVDVMNPENQKTTKHWLLMYSSVFLGTLEQKALARDYFRM